MTLDHQTVEMGPNQGTLTEVEELAKGEDFLPVGKSVAWTLSIQENAFPAGGPSLWEDPEAQKGEACSRNCSWLCTDEGQWTLTRDETEIIANDF